ncbi:MAG: ketol-acid reductoisomerase [candidate division Zixibacteria bacterium]|nr:ketol-acid reductoisomerase [candidate division Zixibacteria bacterium]
MTKKDRIAIIGYGSQGQALALNLRDSGYNVRVGLRPRSKSLAMTKKDKIKTATIPEVITDANFIIIAIPDHIHAAVIDDKFFSLINKTTALVFLHGSSIHFKQVTPPKEMPILLLAPHAPGVAVRENYLNKEPFSAFYSVHQGSLKKGINKLIVLARAIGIPKSHLVKTTIGDEAVGDLFGEQAVLCGGLARMLKFGFETLVEGGLPKQNAYLEVAYQLDLIVELVKKYGLDGMLKRISPMARYGSVINGPNIIRPQVKKDMKKILSEIKSGKFLKKADRTKLKYSKKQYEKLVNSEFDIQVKKFKV